MRLPDNVRGVTLLEILIVTAIVAMLAAIAYPNYRDYTHRAQRSEPKAKLLEIAANQERYYLNANRYGTLAELGYPVPLTTQSGNYTITIPRNDAEGYSISAAFNHSGNEKDRCSSFTIDELGNKTSIGSIDNCWTDQR
ncbi:MAG: type IV pilin protein [Woeseiaceae bacterium]